MLAPPELLAQLEHLSNSLAPLAIAWHLVIGAALLSLFGNWRPSERTFAWGLSALALSVAISAALVANPFNAISFTILAAVLAVTRRAGIMPTSPSKQRWVAAALIVYGGLYPHFLHAPAIAYVAAAPVGVIPCPTLAMLAGLALLANVQSRSVLLALAVWSLVYGAIGLLWLGVLLDLGLTVAFGALLARSFLIMFPRSWSLRVAGTSLSSTTTSKIAH